MISFLLNTIQNINLHILGIEDPETVSIYKYISLLKNKYCQSPQEKYDGTWLIKHKLHSIL